MPLIVQCDNCGKQAPTRLIEDKVNVDTNRLAVPIHWYIMNTLDLPFGELIICCSKKCCNQNNTKRKKAGLAPIEFKADKKKKKGK